MANCIYCGNPAGLLKVKHKECEKAFQEGNFNILTLISAYLENEEPLENFQNRLSDILYKSYISEANKMEIIFKGIITESENFVNQKRFNMNQLKKFFELIYSLNLINEVRDNISYKNLIAFLSENISEKISKDLFSKGMIKIEEDVNCMNECIMQDSIFKNATLIKSLEKAIYNSLEDGVVTEEEEKSIKEFINHFQFSIEELSSNEGYLKLVKSLVLREILNGNLPKRIEVTNQVPFNLQKNERLIWLINGVDYYEDRVRKQYVGGYQGVSLRIARGVYYRVGGFRGHPADTVEKVYLGKGILGFTSKHLYFFNNKTSLRIRYDKIISISPSSDGFTILKDGVTAKHQTFIDGDGWFSFNMVSNLSQIDVK